MDGVLVDNHQPWLEFDKKFLGQYDFEPDNDYRRFVNGRSEEEVITWVKEKYNLYQSEEEIMNSRQNWMREIYEVHAKPMEGVEEFMDELKNDEYAIALASGAKMWQIEIILNRFKWKDLFGAVVSSDHVGYKGKPDPEIYSHTARLLKIDPSDCVVVEDAENGVESAKRAGMKCIGYKDSRCSSPDNLSKADLIVNSFFDARLMSYLGF